MIIANEAKRMLKCVLALGLAMAAASVAIGQQPAPTGPLMLFFDWGKPDIRSDDQAVLDQAVAAWRASPGSRLALSGHTDRSGGAAFNLTASRKRAEMVRHELEKRGVPSNAISVAGYGEERPMVPTEDGVREVQNRRVEIRIER
ncbi:MAG TPA: OmpA family protein [Sphingomicrobium sp.]|jgi:outer membrane protein OmpA-like peptidoglycan-associated protein|nr:OmpA family protein [Sphingomicrobium sp.]